MHPPDERVRNQRFLSFYRRAREHFSIIRIWREKNG